MCMLVEFSHPEKSLVGTTQQQSVKHIAQQKFFLSSIVQ
jgi:hypothetical protein